MTKLMLIHNGFSRFPVCVFFSFQLIFISHVILRIDRDMKTKKTFWYTISESWRGTRNEVPESFKKDFAEKQITCGWSYRYGEYKFALTHIYIYS